MKCDRCAGRGTIDGDVCGKCGGWGANLPFTVTAVSSGAGTVKLDPPARMTDRRPFGEDPCACPHCEERERGDRATVAAISAAAINGARHAITCDMDGDCTCGGPRVDETPARLDGAAYADLRARLRRSIEAVETWRDVGTPRHRVILAELREVLRRLGGA